MGNIRAIYYFLHQKSELVLYFSIWWYFTFVKGMRSTNIQYTHTLTQCMYSGQTPVLVIIRQTFRLHHFSQVIIAEYPPACSDNGTNWV